MYLFFNKEHNTFCILSGIQDWIYKLTLMCFYFLAIYESAIKT